MVQGGGAGRKDAGGDTGGAEGDGGRSGGRRRRGSGRISSDEGFEPGVGGVGDHGGDVPRKELFNRLEIYTIIREDSFVSKIGGRARRTCRVAFGPARWPYIEFDVT